MTTAHASPPEQSADPLSGQDTVLDSILGVAIFGQNGLPQEYFVTPDYTSTNWVQGVFQALGLNALLMSSLPLEGLAYIDIAWGQYTALVMPVQTGYLALLLREAPALTSPEQSEQVTQWICHFEQHTLRQHPGFTPV